MPLANFLIGCRWGEIRLDFCQQARLIALERPDVVVAAVNNYLTGFF